MPDKFRSGNHTSRYGSKHRPIFYQRPAFGSKQEEVAFDATEFLQIKGKVDFRKYHRPEMFANIGLFDLWVEAIESNIGVK